MCWAAACVDISPLALPSPEHELTDPMHGVTASIPGSHSRSLLLRQLFPGGLVDIAIELREPPYTLPTDEECGGITGT
ncbi:uncharacterized protein LACBIDRAFT_299832 [Laccaria bicolor S238N-H82]|uniref:Predicted protein n=1 Tax=Laccaria bicolor (strain S238N-H82 / ATCC MYA-4686) TaxID=486041 RepID=B0DFI9_LACBS|nr:uncharacterized protein LACBIDRAFT_299832 [Laccaria bicolor S238N-H82]EDR06713.1 predicted protein [Laccaria bicolor S238N-H82]|eukprot:XP_001882560.1 predicted protein [Laccaria bicolor S238N-H82]